MPIDSTQAVPNRYGSLRPFAAAFGVCYVAAFVLLGDLLGSSADSTETFTEYWESDARVAANIIGGVLLMAAAVFAVCCGLIVRHESTSEQPGLRADLLPALATLAGAGLFVSAGLLLTPPILQSIGDAFSDPGLAPDVAAGVAQAGTIVLICTVLLLGGWTVLVAHAGRAVGACGRPWVIAAWIVAAFALAGVTVGAALPLGLWWIAIAWRWRRV